MLMEIISAGFFISIMAYIIIIRYPTHQLEEQQTLTAKTKPQFATGPQKWVVFGPVG
jgi:hypothetical protein